jgi:hypothetical protein
MVSGAMKSEEELTHKVQGGNADDNEAFKDQLDTKDPSPAVDRIGSCGGTDRKKSDEGG